ncbi:hypothetical protein J5751_03695, partial [bacterium]|nr:hypothetical protein [bacterium]
NFQKYNDRGTIRFRNDCKECHHFQCKKWEQEHKEQRQEYKKQYEIEHKEELRLKRHERFKKYGKEITEKRKPYQDEYREKNRERLNAQKKEYYAANKEELLSKLKEKRKTDEYKEYHNKYITDRIKNDKLFATTVRVRKLLFRSFSEHGFTKNKKARDLIGCDFDKFHNYLLKTFKDNYGYEWDGVEEVHIDHIIPLATAKTEKDIEKLCNYKNLQLLKASDNMSKKDRLDWNLEDR